MLSKISDAWCRRLALVCIGLAALASLRPAQADAVEESGYSVQLWFDAVFDKQGHVVELKPHDEASQPAALWQQWLPRVKQARIQPRAGADGQPATFGTGVVVLLKVAKSDSGQGLATMTGLLMLPLVLEEYAASYPKDVGSTAGWEGVFDAICKVGVQGRCVTVDVKAPAGMPDSVRRFARVSMEGWRFRPQEINGQPIEGEYVWSVFMRTSDAMPVNFRRDTRRN